MDVRRAALSVIAVLMLAVAFGCCQWCPETTKEEPEETGDIAVTETPITPKIFTPEETRFVVTVPIEGAQPGQPTGMIVPLLRSVGGATSLTFVNLCSHPVQIRVPDTVFEVPQPAFEFTLNQDEARTLALKKAPDGEYIYSIEGPPGGCVTGLPTPRVIIP